MFRLQKIFRTSQATKLKAVRRVTQDNRVKRIAGIDGIKSKKNDELITVKQYTDVPIERFVKVRVDKFPYDGDILYWSLRLNNHPITSKNVSKLLKRQKRLCSICKLPFFPTDILE